MHLKAKLGYTAAGLTLVAAFLAPFFLYGFFTRGFSSLGLQVDEMYSGGPIVRTVQAGNYSIAIHRPVSPHMWQSEQPFVQVDWKPVNALPAQVSDLVDIDGDGTADLRVNFDVPADPKAKLHVNVESFNPRYKPMHNVTKEKFSALIVRVDDAILIRIPLRH